MTLRGTSDIARRADALGDRFRESLAKALMLFGVGDLKAARDAAVEAARIADVLAIAESTLEWKPEERGQ